MSVAWGLLSTARINDRVIEAAHKSACTDVVAVASRSSARMDATVELEPASWSLR
jgi:hypothetical protein